MVRQRSLSLCLLMCSACLLWLLIRTSGSGSLRSFVCTSFVEKSTMPPAAAAPPVAYPSYSQPTSPPGWAASLGRSGRRSTSRLDGAAWARGAAIEMARAAGASAAAQRV